MNVLQVIWSVAVTLSYAGSEVSLSSARSFYTEGESVLLRCTVPILNDTIHFNQGETTKIECFSGFSSCWGTESRYKIKITGTRIDVTIVPFQSPKDAGIWTCSISTTSSNPVSIYKTNPISRVTLTPTSVEIPESSSQTFTCRTDAGGPNAKIHWYLSDGTNLTSLATQQPNCKGLCPNLVNSTSRLVYNGSLTDHGKNLFCEASNVQGESVISQNVSLVISYGPTSVVFVPSTPSYEIIEGGSVENIICNASCRPDCKMTWNGPNLLIGTESELILKNISRNQSGVYGCTAKNSIGSKMSLLIDVKVLYAPFTNMTLTTNPGPFVNEGSNVTLTCIVYGGNPPANVSLKCDGRNYVVELTINETFTTQVSVTFKVNRSDNGMVCRCEATHYLLNINSPIAQTERIHVYFPPNPVLIFKGILNDTELYEFDIVDVNCSVYGGNPFAEIDLTCGLAIKGQVGNDSLSSFSSISVKVTRAMDRCVCTARHRLFDNDILGIVLPSINYPPSKPNLLVSPDKPLFEGDFVEITCNVTGGNPRVHSYEWYVNSIIQRHHHNKKKLVYGNVSEIDNNNDVFCRVHNRFTDKRDVNMDSDIMELNVEYTPRIFEVLQNVTLNESQNTTITCSARGNPAPSMSWTHNGQVIIHTNKSQSVLYLTDINREEQGSYTCVAKAYSLSHGPLTSSVCIQVTVNYPPDVSVVLLGQNTSEGSSITLLCNASGQPAEYKYAEWEHTFQNLNIQHPINHNGSYLFLKQVSYQDMGNYTCNVDNGIKKRNQTLIQKASHELKISGLPIRIPETSEVPIITTEQFNELDATISFFSYPNVTKIKWYNLTSNDQLLSNDYIKDNKLVAVELPYTIYNIPVNLTDYCYRVHLTIYNFQSYHSGYYAVEVSNDLGKVNFTVRATISGPPDHPSNVTVYKIGTTISINILPGFNGGHPQTLHVNFTLCGEDKMVEKKFQDSGTGWQNFRIDNLQEFTKYCLFVFSSNQKGFSSYNASYCCEEFVITTRKKDFASDNMSVAAIAGGSVGSILGIVAIVFVIIFLLVRRNDKGTDRCTDRQHLRCKTRDNNGEDEDGLKDNPFYGSASHNSRSDAYSAVSKNMKKKTYLTTDNENKKKTSKQKAGQSMGEFQLGTVYENSNNFVDLNNETVYANQNRNQNLPTQKRQNKEGLIYVDLDLAPQDNDKTFVIRGLENKTNYALIDFNQTAEALPSDDEDEFGQDFGKNDTGKQDS